jgi:hypothetical protein
MNASRMLACKLYKKYIVAYKLEFVLLHLMTFNTYLGPTKYEMNIYVTETLYKVHF